MAGGGHAGASASVGLVYRTGATGRMPTASMAAVLSGTGAVGSAAGGGEGLCGSAMNASAGVDLGDIMTRKRPIPPLSGRRGACGCWDKR